jgi:hypothetical protein
MYSTGTLLAVETEKLIKHNLVDGNQNILSIITYSFERDGEATTLHAQEVLNNELSDSQFQDSSHGWDFALGSVNKLAEELQMQRT